MMLRVHLKLLMIKFFSNKTRGARVLGVDNKKPTHSGRYTMTRWCAGKPMQAKHYAVR